jgi:cell division protein FtsW (lipid II flippase)
MGFQPKRLPRRFSLPAYESLSSMSTSAHRPKGSSDRWFGLAFAGLFFLIGFAPLRHEKQPRVWSLVAAMLFLVAALTVPRALAPLNRIWTKFGDLLNQIISPVALSIVFFTTVTLSGWIMLLLRRNLLGLKRNPRAATYWIERTTSATDPKSFEKQF